MQTNDANRRARCQTRRMALKLLIRLLAYYAALGFGLALVLHQRPEWQSYLPVGRMQALIAQGSDAPARSLAIQIAHPETIGGSVVWLIGAVLGAMLTAWPVSWVYMKVRSPHDYDQSVVDTIVVLPLVVTGIVVIVQHSLALSFSLAGIAGAARYRNTLKSSGDLLFVLLAIGIGLSAGIGAVELALVTSAAFNLCFLALWVTSYGERADMKRYLGEVEHRHTHSPTSVTETTAVVTEVTETFAPR